jgi:predicted TIM-barrel fold metal-dependent hydrolase
MTPIAARSFAIALMAHSITAAAGQPSAALKTPVADHHQHLMSPTLAAAWKLPAAVTADNVIAQLDSAGIRRAAVLSIAYAWGSDSLQSGGVEEYARVRAENDWTAAQAARYPDRLVAFCSVNPLKAYAMAEIDRCAAISALRAGLKLHFANSGVDLRDRGHVQQLRRVFRAANGRRMAIVAHVWTGDDRVGIPFGKMQAETFVNEILPEAPDVIVQVAHLGGSGPRLDPNTMAAMIALSEAAATGTPRMRNVYFDMTTNVMARSSRDDAAFMAARIRTIGVQRILYGSDMAVQGNPAARESWATFRMKTPLTAQEFDAIAANIAPYFRTVAR